MSRKVTLIKKNPAPAAKPLGVNPQDPWSAKANIAEASEKELLHRFLKAKGINPMFVSTDTKIAHSKSGEYIKWRRDHDFQEQIEPEILKQMIDEGVFTDDESIAKHLVKKYGKNVDAHQIRLAHHFHPEKHKTTPERIAGHVNRLLGKPVTEESIDEGVFTDDESIAKHLVKKHGKDVRPSDIKLAMHFHPEPHKTSLERIAGHVKRLVGGPKPVSEGKSPRLTSLDKFRQAAAEREKKHNEIEKQMKARHAAGKEDMKGSIDRLEKHLNKEESEVNEASLHGNRKISPDEEKIIHKKTLKMVKHSLAGYLGDSKAEEHHFTKATEIHADLHKTHGKKHADHALHAAVEAQRIQKIPSWVKEEVELDEADQKFIDSLNKLAKTHKVGDSVTVNSKFFGKQKGKVTKVDNQSVHVVRDGKSSSEKYPHDAVVKEAAGVSKTKETQFHKKLDTLVHNTFGKRKDEMKEEVEQIDEISKSTLDSYKDKSSASLKNAKMNRDASEPGKNMSKAFADLHAKSNAIAKKRVKGLMGYLQRKQGVKPMGEDVYQDAQAATQTAFDMGTTPNQTEPTSSRRSEMSKSARIIKSLYKKHKMVKEEMYDHEKEDKSVQTYGKKPKMAATDKKDSFGENKPDAAAIMSGGTTLTGGKRDDVEIDPMMRNKPGQNVFNKEFGKKGS